MLGIYAYTLYQQKQKQDQIEDHYQSQAQQFLHAANFTVEEQKQTEEIMQQVKDISTSQKAEYFQQTLLEQMQAQQLAKQKALELQAQTQTLQQAAVIAEKLKQAQDNLSTFAMS
jgi:hypothetical protein